MLSLTLSNSNENPDDNNQVEDPTNPEDPTENPEGPTNPDDPETPNESEKFKTPCFETETYSIVRYFYELDADKEIQEMSLIQYGNKYFISKGVSYTLDGETSFDVYSAMSGTVKEVTESDVYGITVVIDHGNGIETEYVGLSETNVEKDNLVNQGDLIGVSGCTEYDVEAKNHVHFKVSLNGQYYNPLDVIGKTVDDLTNKEQ